jgi:hypothetical protein
MCAARQALKTLTRLPHAFHPPFTTPAAAFEYDIVGTGMCVLL